LSVRRRLVGAAALGLSLSLVAAACGSDGGSGTAQPDFAGRSAMGSGGVLTFGAEQEPDCMDWIASCAGSSWGAWMVQYQTIPRAFDVVNDGDGWAYRPSVLLAGEPEVRGGARPVVTYEIRPEAVWDDGTPITCQDLAYTWKAITEGEDIYDTTGYADIESVTATGDKTCAVTWARPYAGWRAMFTSYGVLPAHLLEGEDRSAIMSDGYSFSGGPFKLENWTKGSSISLVPNPAYWGDRALAERVTFKVIPDTTAYFQAFKAGEVLAIYPQPQVEAVAQIDQGLPGSRAVVSADSGNIEALWMNNARAPFDSRAVRQAFAHSIDRDQVVERLFGGLGVTKAVHSLNPPVLAAFSDQEAFAGYTRDLKKVDQLMTGDGWQKGPDGIWAKGGRKATIEFKTTAGNRRRELTQEIVQAQAREAGFDVTVNNQKAGDLFGKQLPAGDYQLALYAQVVTDLEPIGCAVFCSKNIPGPENDFAGLNWQRVSIAGLDALLLEVESAVDAKARIAANRKADRLQAEHMVSLPLDPLPTIALVSERVRGPVEANPVTSVFGNMSEWSLG
jgi:peptide/nickel transport system substrate-binding protein